MKTHSSLWRPICKHHQETIQSCKATWARLVLPLLTILSAVWFLVRVIPKPSRASYPCQQAAFPLLSACILWLLGLKGALFAWLRMKRASRSFRRGMVFAGLILALALVTWAAEKAPKPAGAPPKGLTYGSPSGDPPNSPMGVAKGIFPGRVTWIRDTNATPWTATGGTYWWEDTNGVNQLAVDKMISASLRALTGAAADSEAWDKIFRYYNANHSRGDVGYSSNEGIAIKINLNNMSVPGGEFSNYSEASKQTVRSLLWQLVNKAGVQQTNIAVYDAVRKLPLWLYAPCQEEFPGVQWYCSDGTPSASNVWRNTWVTNSSQFSVSNACGGPLVVPDCVRRATYLINLPLLKGHIYAGVTLGAKNHYGSIPNRDHGVYLSAWRTNTPLYSMLVDLMGSRELGDKTILYVNDALFGNLSNESQNNRLNCGFANLFNNQWSASIFMSLDPVAIDSVGVDFLYSEFGSRLGKGSTVNLVTNCDHYLHEAALADHPPSGTLYQPDGVPLSSLGVHEHWNNPIDKQYSRNLSTNGTGIELLALHQIPATVLTITFPTNGAALGGRSNIVIQAAAITNYSAITRVDFYANDVLLGSSTTAPFQCEWTNAAWGNWRLRAVGTDVEGNCTTSPIVTVDIGVSLAITNPSSGLAIMEGTDLPIQTRIVSGFGAVAKAQFFANEALIGTTVQAPFDMLWSTVPPGAWSLRVVATDVPGNSATSAVVNVQVKRDIRVSLDEPVSGGVFAPGSEIKLCATAQSIPTEIVRVDFNANGMLIASTTNTPYVAVFTNPAPGLWSITATATETGGFSASSAAAQIAVKPITFRTAGTLYVDLQATNCARDGTTWTNAGTLGDFNAGWAVTFQTNAAETYLPAAEFTGPSYLNGPLPVPDIEGASDRSLEIWVFRRVISSDSAMMMWGSQDHAFMTLYDFTWAFAQMYNSSSESVGWGGYTNVPVEGLWHHFVYVYDGTTNMGIYVDGTLRAANSFGSPLSTGQTGEPGMVLGHADTGGITQIGFTGFINSVRLHGGVLNSNEVMLNYLAGPCEWNGQPLTFLEQPQDALVTEGGDASFTVATSDPAPLSFQWYSNGIPIVGATGATCVLAGVQWRGTPAQICCLVSRSNNRTSCTATTRLATLSVLPNLPMFTRTEASNGVFNVTFTAVPGGNYTLECTDDLSSPVWRRVRQDQAVSNTISLSNLGSEDKRFYRVSRGP